MPRIDEFLKIAIGQRASDIHFSADEKTLMRVDGDLTPVDNVPRSGEELKEIFFEILTEVEKERYLTAKNLDKSHVVEGCGFFRVNMFWTRRGPAAVLRTIPKKIPTVEELNLPPACTALAEAPKGLVLVTGPTGSGKSTTLAAMINHINSNLPYHILTAEDPVEFVHQSKKSLINQREIGSSCPTFADALKYALREDPDVILVGEMRDLETISLALTAAETGHLVFGTLHTRGAGASVDRIIDSFPANQQAMIRTMLSESLVGVVSQALLKRVDKGRAAAFEIMVVNHAIANLIREGKTFQIPSIIQTGRKEGMILMDQHIIELVDKGIVSPEEAEAYLEDPAPLQTRKKNRPIPVTSPGSSPAKPAAPPPALKAVPGGKTAAPPPMPATAPPPVPKAATPVAPPVPKAPPSAPPIPSAAASPPPRPAAPPAPPPVSAPPPIVAATPPPAAEPPAEPATLMDEENILTDLTATGEQSLTDGNNPENPFTYSGVEDETPLPPPTADETPMDLSAELDEESVVIPGEDPFAPTPEEALSSEALLDMPSTGEFSETKVVDRDDTATSEVKLSPPPKPAPPPPSKTAPPPPTPRPAPAAAAPPPPAPKVATPSGIPGRTLPPPPVPAGKKGLPPPPPPGAVKKKAG